MALKLQSKREIVTRAFFETGDDGADGLIEYIDRLERLVLMQDKALNNRMKSKSRNDISGILEHARRVKSRYYAE